MGSRGLADVRVVSGKAALPALECSPTRELSELRCLGVFVAVLLCRHDR